MGRIWNLALDDFEKMMLRKNCDLVPGADMEKGSAQHPFLAIRALVP